MDAETRTALQGIRSDLNDIMRLLEGLTKLALADCEEVEDDDFPTEGNA